MKPGDKVIVTKRLYGHGFEIGEEIELVKYSEIDDDWLCKKGRSYFFLTEEELELGEA